MCRKGEKKGRGKGEKGKKRGKNQGSNHTKKKVHAHLFPLRSCHFLDLSEICYLE